VFVKASHSRRKGTKVVISSNRRIQIISSCTRLQHARETRIPSVAPPVPSSSQEGKEEREQGRKIIASASITLRFPTLPHVFAATSYLRSSFTTISNRGRNLIDWALENPRLIYRRTARPQSYTVDVSTRFSISARVQATSPLDARFEMLIIWAFAASWMECLYALLDWNLAACYVLPRSVSARYALASCTEYFHRRTGLNKTSAVHIL
jgi:hypothetical protein